MRSSAPARQARRREAFADRLADLRRDPLPALAAAASLAYVAMVAWVVASRIGYRYELEFIEGAVLDQAVRVAHGKPLYVAPSLAYVPLNYTPLYFWLAAAASRVVGEGFFAMRLVAWGASLAAGALLWAIVRRESGRAAPAWLAVGLLAATFRVGGAWFDVARADTLQMALVLAGAWALRRRERAGSGDVVAAGVLFALGFLAKQSALVLAAPLVAWQLARDVRRGALLAVVTAVATGGAVLALDAASHGWFRYYAFTVAGFHRVDRALFTAFPRHDLPRFWPLLVLAVLAAVRPGVPRSAARLGFVAAFASGALGLAWLLRCYRGAYDNALLSAHVAIALAGALAFSRLTAGENAGRAALARRLAACALVAAQLVLLRWSPAQQVPRAGDAAAGDDLVAHLRTHGEGVFVPTHPYLAERAGLAPVAHVMPLMDLIRDGHGPRERALQAGLDSLLRAHAWDAIVLDARDWLEPGVRRAGYVKRRDVFPDPDAFWTVTGLETRPEAVWGADTARAAAR